MVLTERYTVKAVRGIGLGAGGFVVLDTLEGREFFPGIWRDEAERTAARLNAQWRSYLSVCKPSADGVLGTSEDRQEQPR